MNLKRLLHIVLGVGSVMGLGVACCLALCTDKTRDLVRNSELGGRSFAGVVEELSSNKEQIKAFYMEQKNVPIAAISFIFERAGYAYDEKNKQGIANLMAETLLFGAGDLNTQKLRDEMNQKGITVSFDVNADVFMGQMTAPKEYWDDAVAVLAAILQTPRFEKKYTDNAKSVIVKLIDVEKENPSKELNLAFAERMYGEHPYGWNKLGNKEAIGNLQQRDLMLFAEQKLRQDNLFVGIAGDLTRSEAMATIDKVFGGLQKTAGDKDIEVPNINWKSSVLNIERRSGQNMAVWATKATCRLCEDFYPLYIANYLFGGAGLNSRFNKRVREEKGLTYGGYSTLVMNDKSDIIIAGVSATKDNFEQILKLFRQEWEKIAKNGFEAKELEQAKNYLKASYNLRFASIAGIAEMLAIMQKDNLGIEFLQKRNEYVENVSLEQLNKAAKKYFSQPLLQANMGILN